MSNLISLSFENIPVRILEVNGEIYAVASDMTKILGYKHTASALRNHVDAEDVLKQHTLTNGGKQLLTYVNESGIYALIFGSDKPEAKKIKRWVTSEVLPSIRTTGSYTLTINPEQQQAIKSAVQAKAHRDYHGSYQATYRDFYKAFNIPRYQELPAAKFDEAMVYLTDGFKAQPKALEITEDLRTMLYSACYESLNANHESGKLLIALKVFDEQTALFKLRSIIESNTSIMKLAKRLGLHNKNNDPLISDNGFLSFENGGGYRLDSRLFAM